MEEREEKQGKERRGSGTRWGARTTYLNRLQLLQMYVYTSQDTRKTSHLPVTPAQLMRPGIGQNTSCSVGANIFRFSGCGLLFTHVHTHMNLQRMEEASKELNARRLAVDMIKEQLKIPDVEAGSGLSRKEKQG